MGLHDTSPDPSNVTLYRAALRLYGALLDRDPPDGCPEDSWDRLIAASRALFLIGARRPAGGDEAVLRLRDLAGITRECLDLLEQIHIEAPLLRRAWMCLSVVVEELEAELAAMAGPASSSA